MPYFNVISFCLILTINSSVTTLSQESHENDSPNIIFGGVEAKKGEFPWIIEILLANVTVCGGSLIHKSWVMTAAHCFAFSKENCTLIAGDHKTTADEGTEQIRTIENIYYFGFGFNKETFKNDISLIKVSPPFTLNDFVKPIRLSYNKLNNPDNLMIIGRGNAPSVKHPSEVLLKANVSFVNDSECQKDYLDKAFFPESMMCAREIGTDNCISYSGGPLMCYSGDHVYLCGITSWGDSSDCGISIKPGVYTEIYLFTDWIKNTISTYSSAGANNKILFVWIFIFGIIFHGLYSYKAFYSSL